MEWTTRSPPLASAVARIVRFSRSLLSAAVSLTRSQIPLHLPCFLASVLQLDALLPSTGFTRAHAARACGSLSIILHALCAGKTGKVVVGTHGGPESCAAARKGGGEALTGVRGGRVSSRERQLLRGADAVGRGGRPHPGRRYCEAPRDPARSQTPSTYGSVPGEAGAEGVHPQDRGARSACAPHHANADRSADVGTCVTTPRGAVVGAAASLNARQRRRWVLPAVSRGRGSGTVAVAGKGAGGPHPGSAMDRAGATDSYGGGEGDGVRGGTYGAISRSG